ncbi:MAG: hypothetical protein ABMA00_18975, partial [Gemmatimonas sp.]
MTTRFFIRSLLLVAAVASPVYAQRGGAPPRIQKNPQAIPFPADSAPAYVRKDAPTDPTILKIWDEGMHRSQAATLSQVLMDSIGPRLTGSPNMM